MHGCRYEQKHRPYCTHRTHRTRCTDCTHRTHRTHRTRRTQFHCTFPSKVVEPRPPGPSHSTAICHVPAIPKSAVTAYRPGVPDRVTCIPPDITIPGIGMLALARTAPTSTSAPVAAERNSIVKVLRPWLSAPPGARSTTSVLPDRTVRTTSAVDAGSLVTPDRALNHNIHAPPAAIAAA